MTISFETLYFLKLRQILSPFVLRKKNQKSFGLVKGFVKTQNLNLGIHENKW